MKRSLNNGILITKVKSPQGGDVYYADAGPEGKIMVWDTNLVPVSVLTACLAWHFDKDEGKELKPHLDFNPVGFRT